MERGTDITIISKDIENLIAEKAHDLGFFQIGFAKSTVDHSTKENYQKWIDSGYHSEMKWMERNIDKRNDPSLILEDCKSVIVLSYSYNNKDYKSNNYKISRYAWGKDYHNVVLDNLNLLARYITELFPDSKNKAYVDTGAILEKYWGERAGIGWQGKNSLLINKHYGSYFFIGIILTTLEFQESNKSKNYCGSCKKCLNSCPTSAIIKDKVIDSEKCISYWTIESKERDFPSNIIENLNDWAFGCDICQEVCPWNHKALRSFNPAFDPINDETNFIPEKIKLMTNEEFKTIYKYSPINRRKLNGIIKNIEYLK